MAPQQNTFAVIPDAPGRVGGPANRPPMTSKQAQKLYKQANKEPKRSKAEQRKWEKEKQEEIRKELEKERAAVKAKAARDRKKAKEEEARENRRRAGQPLFDCRPSQDTIARFVRGNGTHKKRDSSGEPIPKPEITPAILADIKPNTLASTAASKPPLPTESTEERKPSINSMAPPPRPSQIPKSAMPPPQGTSTSTNLTSHPQAAILGARKDSSSDDSRETSFTTCCKVQTKALHDAQSDITNPSATSAQDLQAKPLYPAFCSYQNRGPAAKRVAISKFCTANVITSDASTPSTITDA
ncbi:hypothetical protein SGCOL_011433 [Colletotrichum sp. CLE4]